MLSVTFLLLSAILLASLALSCCAKSLPLRLSVASATGENFCELIHWCDMLASSATGMVESWYTGFCCIPYDFCMFGNWKLTPCYSCNERYPFPVQYQQIGCWKGLFSMLFTPLLLICWLLLSRENIFWANNRIFADCCAGGEGANFFVCVVVLGIRKRGGIYTFCLWAVCCNCDSPWNNDGSCRIPLWVTVWMSSNLGPRLPFSLLSLLTCAFMASCSHITYFNAFPSQRMLIKSMWINGAVCWVFCTSTLQLLSSECNTFV